MQVFFQMVIVLAALNFASQSMAERVWKDRSGQYEVQGDLIGFNDELAILKKSDGTLLAFPRKELSEDDAKFLESKEAMAVHQIDGKQKWTMQSGLEIVGSLVSHVDKEVVLQLKRGKLYVNDRPFENLPAVYQAILPRVVGHFENQQFADGAELLKWITKKGFRPVTYKCEGVLMAMENGDEYAFPYFLFSDADRQFLESGKQEYRATDNSAAEKEKHDLYMQTLAAEYQRNRVAERDRQTELQANRQVQMLQLQLLSVATGLTDCWEVSMIPPNGNFYQAQSVVVPARNSGEAQQKARQAWPNYVVGATRRVNRNR